MLMQHGKNWQAVKRKIPLLLAVWLVLAASWAWLCEPLLAWALPGLHTVEHWLALLAGGELMLALIAFVVGWRLLGRQQQ